MLINHPLFAHTVDDDYSNSAEKEVAKGRLLISEKDKPLAHVFSITNHDFIQTVPLDVLADSLHTSPDGQYALVFNWHEGHVGFYSGLISKYAIATSLHRS